jgi:hypothetical protein
MTVARLMICALVFASVGCRRPARRVEEMKDGCLALPPAVRDSLSASPDGTSLYWLELLRNYDYDADLYGPWRLMRYDLQSRTTTQVVESATGQVRFIGGQPLILRMRGSDARLVLVGNDGHLQELAHPGLDVYQVELVDSHTIVFLAQGLGAQAVYTLDLSELRHYPLIDADALLGTSGATVFVRQGDDIVAINTKTKATTRTPFVDRSVVLGDHLFYVEKEQVILQDIATGTPKPSITTNHAWKLVYQGDTILARTAVDHDKSFAYIITGDRATPLPTVTGGASIVRTVQVGTKMWALVAHNTQNYIGDVGDTNAEADVCLLPSSTEVAYPTRTVPARFDDRSNALFDALRTTAPKATMQLWDAPYDPTTLFFELRNENGGGDFGEMRKRTRRLYDDVTRLLNDREIRTEVMFEDRRHGYYRWRRDRLRYRTTVGMGDALVTDPAEFDFEVSDVDNKVRDEKVITCSGTLRNLGSAIEKGLDIQCSGNRKHLVHVDRLDANASTKFAQTFEMSPDGERPYLQILVDGKPSEPRDKDVEAQRERVFDVAADAYAASGLWLEKHEASDGALYVTLHAEPELLMKAPDQQERDVRTAYDRYLALRAIYELDPKAPVSVHVDVQRTDSTFDFDGALFERY